MSHMPLTHGHTDSPICPFLCFMLCSMSCSVEGAPRSSRYQPTSAWPWAQENVTASQHPWTHFLAPCALIFLKGPASPGADSCHPGPCTFSVAAAMPPGQRGHWDRCSLVAAGYLSTQ